MFWSFQGISGSAVSHPGQETIDMPNRVLLGLLRLSFKALFLFDKGKEVPLCRESIKNILIVNTTAIGDTLLSTPAIRAIRNGFPGARVSALVSKDAKAILLNNPNLDELMEHPSKVDIFYIFKFPSLLYNLRKRAFDLVVILHANDPDAAPLAYLSGAPHRMGWAESRLSFLHTIPVRTRVPGAHIIDTRLKNLEVLGIKNNDRKMELHLSSEEEDTADRLAERLDLTGETFIGLHPFGNKVNRWWPEDNVIGFCNMVDKRFGWRVVIFGGSKESRFAEGMARRAKAIVVTVTGGLSIRESAALIKRCLLFISTDSGPMHIAQALGIPLIALFGPNDPTTVSPLIEPYEIIQRHLSCVPCNSKTCDRDIECMKQITPEDVLEAINALCKKVKIGSYV